MGNGSIHAVSFALTRITLACLAALFLLAACAGDDGEATQTATTATPTPAPTLTATPGITSTPTATPSVAPSPTTTPAAAAESTPSPSVTTPTPTPTITTTPPPSPTPTPSPTPSPTPTAARVPTPSPTPSLGPEIQAAATIASCDFFLEVADTSEERAQGLMGRESLGEDRGMLFVFQRERELSFWMRNTLIPLDILFVDEDLNVIDVQTMRPEHDAEGGSLPIYASTAPAKYAIEVNEGMASRCAIGPGTPVMLREINPADGW